MDEMLIPLIVFALLAGLTAYSAYRGRVYRARLERLRPRGVLFSSEEAVVRVTSPSRPTGRWVPALLFITEKQLIAYARRGDETPLFSCYAHEIEGYWRPQKYQEGVNGIEIHANAAGHWSILKVRLMKSRMMALVRALQERVDEDIVRAYRQRRPYLYRPPAPAHLATQDLYGMWTHGDSFNLYLTPSRLVFLGDGDQVEQVIRLRDLQNIRVFNGIDAASGDLVCFHLPAGKEDIAIAVEDAEAWAQSIATAARRTLEEPVTRKRKAYNEALDDEPDDAEFDMALWESQEYVLGDDGELELRRRA